MTSVDISLDATCPRCGDSVEVRVDDLEDGSAELDCDCGVTLQVSYAVSVETSVSDVEVTSAPPIDFQCPVCGVGLVFDDVYDESGSASARSWRNHRAMGWTC